MALTAGYSRCSAMACSSETPRPFWMVCLEARIDIGLFLHIVSAQRSAAANASPCGTTSLTKPSSWPSRALTCPPFRIMPIARFSPICRGSRCNPPATAARPTRGSGNAKIAFSAAMMRSQASAISKPPPMATPLTAAIISLSQSKREVSPANPPLSQPRFPPAACHFRSLPAQNALSPAPVTIATHCSGSAEKSSNTFCNSKWASVCSALYTSGRDSVTVVTGPLRVTTENFNSMFSPRGVFLWRGMSVPILTCWWPLALPNYARRLRARSHIHCLTWCCLTWGCLLTLIRMNAGSFARTCDNHNKKPSGRTALDFALPAGLVAYLDELDRFIAREIKPIEQADDNIRFFDHRREWARTDFDNGGLPRHEWEALLRRVKNLADDGGHLRFAIPKP